MLDFRGKTEWRTEGKRDRTVNSLNESPTDEETQKSRQNVPECKS